MSTPLETSLPPKRLQWKPVLDWMLEDDLIDAATHEQTTQRLRAASSHQHPLQRLASLGLSRKKDGMELDIEALTQWLAGRCAMPYLRIDPLKVDVGQIPEVMSIGFAERCQALPLTVSASEVTIGTCEPFDRAWVSDIQAHLRKPVRLVLISPAARQQYTAEFYALSRSVREAQRTGQAHAGPSFEQLVELGRRSGAVDANDQGVVQVVDWLWQYAFEQRASDIHLEPRPEMGAIRFRIDGVMHTVYQMPIGVLNAMTARVKALGRMDVVERRRPQDGRIKTRRPGGQDIEMRISTLPTAFGEKMVMRIFDPEATVRSLSALGFSAQEASQWEEMMTRPHGVVLVTGPTGSGKTTTLYASLRKVATEEVNVCTLEDPIEMIHPALNQTQVQAAVDLGFAEGLRALMRQDPDVIMVGEIRDLETADMAAQAALTGHLVLSTLHTNDSVAALTRLLDLGLAPYLIAATVSGVLAQRLVRTLCPDCKAPDPDPVKLQGLHASIRPWKLQGEVRLYKPVGCLACRMTGYRGRAGLYELLNVSDAMRTALQGSHDLVALRTLAGQEGLRPLRLAGAAKVAEGLTTLEEVLRATPAFLPPGS